MKILLIEDDVETMEYIVNGLSESGHVVDRAGNGRDGLFLAGGGQYDVLIVDRMLPSVDGLSLVKTLRGADGTVRLRAARACCGGDEGLAGPHEDHRPFPLRRLPVRGRDAHC